jgi:hypothetical protein
MENGTDPTSFANKWSFNGRYYLWVSFFHGMALLTGRDVAAHDAFQGRVYHTEIFGYNGALFSEIDNLAPAEAESRLAFSEKAMNQLRANEVRYLFNDAGSWRNAGLFFGYAMLITVITTITYAVGTGNVHRAYIAFPFFLSPFLAGHLGKRLTRHLWSRKRVSMGSFVGALPWMKLSTSP